MTWYSSCLLNKLTTTIIAGTTNTAHKETPRMDSIKHNALLQHLQNVFVSCHLQESVEPSNELKLAGKQFSFFKKKKNGYVIINGPAIGLLEKFNTTFF